MADAANGRRSKNPHLWTSNWKKIVQTSGAVTNDSGEPSVSEGHASASPGRAMRVPPLQRCWDRFHRSFELWFLAFHAEIFLIKLRDPRELIVR